MPFLLPTVNLPIPILLHALGCCFLGLKLTFTSPIQDRTILGIATTAIGLCYISTSYVPLDKNTILYASVPVRIALAGLAATRLAWDYFLRWKMHRQLGAGNKDVVPSVLNQRSRRGILYRIVLYDGLGGLMLGWWLGTYSGRIPEYQT